jgi:hypothetical protein
MILFTTGTAVILAARYGHHVGRTFAKYMGLK